VIVVQEIAGWEKLKALVLDSVSSPITKRVYNMALNEFLVWMSKRIAAVALQNRIGETFAAVVTGVTPKGVFVRISGPPAEAFGPAGRRCGRSA
jgi:exoribonuclease R